jgi:hypothetical protein
MRRGSELEADNFKDDQSEASNELEENDDDLEGVIFDQSSSRMATRSSSQLLSPGSKPEFDQQLDPNLISNEPIKWTIEEDAKLSQAINIYGSHQWKLIAQHVGTRDPGKIRIFSND